MKESFTLSEVLITLGVIGIVAAMTLPGVIANHRKKVALEKLKTSYSLLEQAFRMAEAKNGPLSDWPEWDNAATILTKYIVPEVKVGKNYKINGENNAVRSMCYEAGQKLKPSVTQPQYEWMTKIGINTPFTVSTASIKLANGACIGLNPNSGNARMGIFMDIDGSDHGENMAGHDLFFFYINSKNQIRPQGDTWTDVEIETIQNGCHPSLQGAGYTCATKIMREGWKINYW